MARCGGGYLHLEKLEDLSRHSADLERKFVLDYRYCLSSLDLHWGVWCTICYAPLAALQAMRQYGAQEDTARFDVKLPLAVVCTIFVILGGLGILVPLNATRSPSRVPIPTLLFQRDIYGTVMLLLYFPAVVKYLVDAGLYTPSWLQMAVVRASAQFGFPTDWRLERLVKAAYLVLICLITHSTHGLVLNLLGCIPSLVVLFGVRNFEAVYRRRYLKRYLEEGIWWKPHEAETAAGTLLPSFASSVYENVFGSFTFETERIGGAVHYPPQDKLSLEGASEKGSDSKDGQKAAGIETSHSDVVPKKKLKDDPYAPEWVKSCDPVKPVEKKKGSLIDQWVEESFEALAEVITKESLKTFTGAAHQPASSQLMSQAKERVSEMRSKAAHRLEAESMLCSQEEKEEVSPNTSAEGRGPVQEVVDALREGREAPGTGSCVPCSSVSLPALQVDLDVGALPPSSSEQRDLDHYPSTMQKPGPMSDTQSESTMRYYGGVAQSNSEASFCMDDKSQSSKASSLSEARSRLSKGKDKVVVLPGMHEQGSGGPESWAHCREIPVFVPRNDASSATDGASTSASAAEGAGRQLDQPAASGRPESDTQPDPQPVGKAVIPICPTVTPTGKSGEKTWMDYLELVANAQNLSVAEIEEIKKSQEAAVSATGGDKPRTESSTLVEGAIHGRESQQGEAMGSKAEVEANAKVLRRQWNMYLGRARSAEDALKLINKYKKPLATWQLVMGISVVAKLCKSLSKTEIQGRIMQSNDFHYLTSQLEDPSEEFNAHGLSHTLWSYAKLGSCPTRLFSNLTGAVERTIPSFNPQDLATTMWAYGTLHHCPKKVLPLLTRAITEKAGKFNAHDIANTLWACAKLSTSDKGMLEALGTQVQQTIGEFKPQELSNSIWAFATLDYLDTVVMDCLVGQAQSTLSEFSAQAISNSIWGFSNLKYTPSQAFLKGAAQETVAKVGTFTAQNLANTLWAFTNLKYYSSDLVEALCLEVMQKLWKFECQHLTSTLWSLARLADTHNTPPWILQELTMAISYKLTQFLPVELANILWAYAKLNHSPGMILYDMTAVAETKLARFRPQEMANILWGLAKLGHHPGAPFLQKVAAYIRQTLSQYRTQDLASTVWAYGTFGLYPEGLVPPLTAEFKKRMGESSPQALSNFVWGLSALGVVNSTLLHLLVECSKIVHQLEAACKSSSNSSESRSGQYLMQVFQSWLAFSVSAPQHLLIQLHQQCDLGAMYTASTMWRHMHPFQSPPNFQRDVSHVLDVLQIPHQHQFLIHNGLCTVDIAIILPHKKMQLAIEVDGPSNFTVNTREVKGKTLLRNRILLNSGWIVISVPYFEWAPAVQANIMYMNARLAPYLK